MKVKISDKEQDRIRTAQEYYQRQGCEVSIENLEVGDYIFSNENNSVVFEFKTIADFITSINDNRVFNESINQAENYDYHFVIIYGSLHERSKQIAISRNFQPITIMQYIGAISSLNRYTTVLQVYNPVIDEAYYTMHRQALKCLKDKPIVKKFPKKDKNPCFNWLAYCNYGINSTRATQIVQELNLKTKKDLDNLTQEQLTKIDGIGPKIAEKIIKNIGYL